jgi:hypothetical protein
MDTTTVLEIIKMIEYRRSQTLIQYNHSIHADDKKWMAAKDEAYDELAHHLQSFIEAQLNAAENQTGE